MIQRIFLEQLRECETKQFTNAIDLLEQCEERHRRNEKKLSRLTIAASAGGALVGQEAVKEVGEITGIIEQVVSGDVSAIGDAAEGLGFDPSQLGLQVGPNGEIVLPGGMMGASVVLAVLVVEQAMVGCKPRESHTDHRGRRGRYRRRRRKR